MSKENTWKAVCVDKVNTGWYVGDIVEVVDGIALVSKCHDFGGWMDEMGNLD